MRVTVSSAVLATTVTYSPVNDPLATTGSSTEPVVVTSVESPVEVVVAKPLAIVTSAKPLETVEVEIRSNATAPVSGTLESRSDCRAQRLDPVSFELAPGERARFERLVRACPGPAGERTTTRFVARLADGREVDLALPLIEYPHVRPTPMPVAATVEVVPMDLVWPEVGEIAYVPGASDRVPAALAEAGLDVTLLTGRELVDADLARFGAIVIGTRAYEADEALGAANARLLDYVKNGGLLLVQYQQYPFVRGGFAPFPMEIARPHDRVTDETSPVTVLVPDDPVFTTPNAIGPADWRGWVQERSLYMPATFDAARPVIEAFAKMVGLMGPAGAGQLTKMVNQICIAGLVQGLAEGIHFAHRSGLDVEKVIGVISKGAAQSWQMENRWKTMDAGKFDFGFAVEWMRKDLSIALTEARANGAKLPAAALVDQFYAEVQAMGGKRWDTSSLIARLDRD